MMRVYVSEKGRGEEDDEMIIGREKQRGMVRERLYLRVCVSLSGRLSVVSETIHERVPPFHTPLFKANKE